MRLRILPWLGVPVLASVLVAVATLPFPSASLLDRYVHPDDRVWIAGDRLRAIQGELQGDLRAFRADEAIARGREIASRHGAAVVIDGSVPTELRAEVDAIAGAAWARLGPAADRANAGVVVYFDSAATPLVRHVRETNRPLEITHALPEVTGNGRCLTIVRMRRATAATMPKSDRLPGPCAFYAVFGAPGRQIREWLGARGFAATLVPDWAGETAWVDRSTTFYFALGTAASACLAEGGTPCRDALAIDPERRRPLADRSGRDRARTILVLPDAAAGAVEVGLAGLDQRLLADMVRDFGETRFRAFWTSSAAPDVAFRDAMGLRLEDWMQQWLGRAAPAPARTAVTGWDTVLWLAIALPLLTIAAVRPRETLVRGGVR